MGSRKNISSRKVRFIRRRGSRGAPVARERRVLPREERRTVGLEEGVVGHPHEGVAVVEVSPGPWEGRRGTHEGHGVLRRHRFDLLFIGWALWGMPFLLGTLLRNVLGRRRAVFQDIPVVLLLLVEVLTDEPLDLLSLVPIRSTP